MYDRLRKTVGEYSMFLTQRREGGIHYERIIE